MRFHTTLRKIVPTLVAAGLTMALSTALVAAEPGTNAPNDHANAAAVAALETDHGKPETAGQPADPGAQGQAHRANHEQSDEGDDHGRDCSPSDGWDNHGQFVSCVAQDEAEGASLQGDDNHGDLVSEAAQSDEGKSEE